jgi:phosphatidylinositol-3-phosphatase
VRTKRLLPVLALLAALVATGVARPAPARAAPPPIRHVFVIVLENEAASTTFGPGSPAPYLSTTLRSQGAYLPHYFGTGHLSNDNYISMISGQAPNPQNQADCNTFNDMLPGTIGANGQAVGSGCVFPTSVPTIASQLDAAGFTWRDYNDSMGATPTRESSVCGHPGLNSSDGTQKATAQDQYATRHNPFVYFHGIIDDTTLCDTHVVSLEPLAHDLSSVATTANYSFITPSLCNDGHDTPCANGQPGGLAQVNTFLHTWVPRITGSPAFKQNGLLIITFDESQNSDTSSCCGEIAGPNSPSPGIGGPGGGDVGAVLLSPCIAPGTVTQTAYNHYTMLRSVEDIFGLSHIGYAGLSGETSFGSDIFKRPCGLPPPAPRVRAPALASSSSASPRIPVSWRAVGQPAPASFAVQFRQTSFGSHPWRTLLASTTRRSLTFRGRAGQSYQFRVSATNAAGLPSAFGTAATVVPSGVGVRGGRYRGGWSVARLPGAWEGRAIVSSQVGSTFTLSYRGGTVTLIGRRWSGGGMARVTLDGHTRTVDLRSARNRARVVLYRSALPPRRHRLTVRVLSGSVALEGVAVAARTG